MLSAMTLVTDRRLRIMIKRHWKVIVLSVLATAIWRIPLNGIFFHGLEYEDSYVYTVAGRQLVERSETPAVAESPFSISACEVGSLLSCQGWESFPEHYMGYPYVIAEFSHMFGYTPSVGSIVNLLASFLSLLLVFSITFSITTDSVAAPIAGFIFATVPVFAVYGLEASAEPFSNVCILLTVWFYLRLCDDDVATRTYQALTGLAYCAALCFALTVKREDILLAIILPITLPFVASDRKSGHHSRSGPVAVVLVTSGLALMLSVKMHLFQTSEGERELLRQFPLNLSRMARFVGSFVSSFLVMSWYEGTIVAVVVGGVVASIKRGRSVVPVILLAAYVLLYASHIRSYYEMQSGRTAPGSALRFSMNFAGLWAIVAGIGIDAIVEWVRTRRLSNLGTRALPWCTAAAAAAALIVSLLATIHLRNDRVEDEKRSRLTPAVIAARFANQDAGQPDFVVTMEPLVIQMYAAPQARVVDLETIDADALESLSLSDSGRHLVFLNEADRITDIEIGRHGDTLRYMLTLPSRVLMNGDGFEIVRIGRPSEAKRH